MQRQQLMRKRQDVLVQVCREAGGEWLQFGRCTLMSRECTWLHWHGSRLS